MVNNIVSLLGQLEMPELENGMVLHLIVNPGSKQQKKSQNHRIK